MANYEIIQHQKSTTWFWQIKVQKYKCTSTEVKVCAFFIANHRMMTAKTLRFYNRRPVRRRRRHPSRYRNSSSWRNAIPRQRSRSCDTCWRNPASSQHRWKLDRRRTAVPEEAPCSAYPSSSSCSSRVPWISRC